ncbi:MAG: NmrA family NAD(P)-binding protein [Actinomycetaceae bacterium]|nr:NmrA family NAD(P)-binding protein [Actinomycetaceae bacterium]
MDILVAGASGYLGRFITTELHRRGYRVRAIVRDRARAEGPGRAGAPSLAGSVDEWFVGDIRDPKIRDKAADGTGWVISALGVTRQGADPMDIDLEANTGLLDSAWKGKAPGFSYVHVAGAKNCPARLVKAKEAFVAKLEDSPLTTHVIEPSAYFSDMVSVLKMARSGLIPILNPTVRCNPIHGADLATHIADGVEVSHSGTTTVGGPEILTWPEIAQLAFNAHGRRGFTPHVPSKTLVSLLRKVAKVDSVRSSPAIFATWAMSHDAVGDPIGSHHLGDFFKEQASAH